MGRMSKACDISPKVRIKVIARDNCECIICRRFSPLQVAHYIGRAQGGLGIEQNLVTLCAYCHADYDNGKHRADYGEYIRNYLKWTYEDWNEDDLVFKKWKGLKHE